MLVERVLCQVKAYFLLPDDVFLPMYVLSWTDYKCVVVVVVVVVVVGIKWKIDFVLFVDIRL